MSCTNVHTQSVSHFIEAAACETLRACRQEQETGEMKTNARAIKRSLDISNRFIAMPNHQRDPYLSP
eukprot:scaffold1726_cov24-Tisochrysis_lutea.AAC.1